VSLLVCIDLLPWYLGGLPPGLHYLAPRVNYIGTPFKEANCNGGLLEDEVQEETKLD
jgi:hypothetical protein